MLAIISLAALGSGAAVANNASAAQVGARGRFEMFGGGLLVTGLLLLGLGLHGVQG